MSVGQVAAVQPAQALVAELGPAVSPRDRAIYQAVCLENRSPVEVGRELGLAATTVRNIAQRTQRDLAKRQHQLDEWSDCESLGYFFDCLTLQYEEVQQAWEASRQTGDRVRETATLTTITLPSGEKQVADKVVTTTVRQRGPGPVGNVRLVSLANSILCHLIGIGVQYKHRRAIEREDRERRGPEAPPREQAANPEQSARKLRELAGLIREIKPRLPHPAALDGPPESRAGRPKRMSRKERNRLEREKALAKSRRETSPPQGVSAPPQAAGGQGVAPLHVASRSPASNETPGF